MQAETGAGLRNKYSTSELRSHSTPVATTLHGCKLHLRCTLCRQTSHARAPAKLKAKLRHCPRSEAPHCSDEMPSVAMRIMFPEKKNTFTASFVSQRFRWYAVAHPVARAKRAPFWDGSTSGIVGFRRKLFLHCSQRGMKRARKSRSATPSLWFSASRKYWPNLARRTTSGNHFEWQ